MLPSHIDGKRMYNRDIALISNDRKIYMFTVYIKVNDSAIGFSTPLLPKLELSKLVSP